ncbi:zinc finger DHHC domain-containing protein, putative [Eimeria acervulina]|uniref:Zinc finger DHHC domain-containing protein, putative n=1 Tax=Eimeria acervulina TaxID=5801 RepID=U6G9U8_EIMAC|nr:zinc finger DHHC domain-containing protein, putative [Eimeria acervulina]CDI76915.1 zinc finger DHHC domain-containing protein, putative [Eimeria acervulina]
MDKEGDQQPLLPGAASGQADAAAAATAAAATAAEVAEAATPGVAAGPDEESLGGVKDAEDKTEEFRGGKAKDKMQQKAAAAAAAGVAPLRYAAPLGGVKGSLLRSLPVLFVLSLLSVVVGVYLSLHIAPLLQKHATDRAAFYRGVWELAVFGCLLLLFLLCFALSVFVPPGTPTESGQEALETHIAAVEFNVLFLLLLGSILDIFLFAVVFLFGAFHTYLLAKGMTTIEFCEKRFRRSQHQPPANMWNLGFWRNFNEAFGYNPLLWFLPIDNRRGDGQHFPLGVSASGDE